MTEAAVSATAVARRRRDLPRLGFLGTGWIGRQRMEVVHRAGLGRVAAVADLDPAAAAAAAAAVGCTDVRQSLDDLLSCDLDAVVIATPTALHAEHVRQALEAGLPVFCQKPLGRTAAECRELIGLARRCDLRLGVDMSYRRTRAVQAVLDALRAGAIGEPYALELVFHNAYGPDKPWARDVELAGGGALMDLGCHLLDLAQLLLGELGPASVHSDLYADGRRLPADPHEVEDLAVAQVTLRDGRVIRLACSWWLPAGSDAVIDIGILGSAGRALRVRNVDGSFYDLEARILDGRRSEVLVSPPDDWMGLVLADWARELSGGACRFDSEVEGMIRVAELLDAIYGRSG